MSTINLHTMTIEALYDLLWTCDTENSEHMWYKIDLAMTELQQKSEVA